MKTKSGKRKAESGKALLIAHSSKLTAPTASSLQPTASRSAFTLTEMLIVISIIGMLAAMSLGALYSARESARIAKTQSTITKLDRIIQARYEEFATRRLPFQSNVRSTPGGLSLASNVKIRFFAEARLRALRKLQQWEMPDKSEDIANPRTTGNDAFVPSDIDVPWTFSYTSGGETWTVSMNRSALARSIFRRCAAQAPTPAGTTDERQNEAASAELLYLWVSCGDREAVEQFQPNEIGDTDEDGYPEFIDAWGEPIRFLRWPTCYYEVSDLMSGDYDNDHSPFDPRRIQPEAYRLIPLVFSKGPDKSDGLLIGKEATTYDNMYDTSVSVTSPQVGRPDGTDDHLDNITNHTLGMN